VTSIPADEPARLSSLESAGILDTPREPLFDELVRQAARICNTPIALLAFVAEQRAWIKASVGTDLTEIPRDVRLCAHTIRAEDLLEVEDTHRDRSYVDDPLVTSPPFIRFYAGVPIRSRNEHAIGALCVADTVPRVLSANQRELLRALARQGATLIELREANARLERDRALFRGVLRAATEYAIIGCDGSGSINVFNEGAERMLAYRASELEGKSPLVFHDADEVAARAAELGIAPGFDVFIVAARRCGAEAREWTYVRKDGTRIPVSLTVTAMSAESGQHTGFVGVARDLTSERIAQRHRNEMLAERAGRAAAERALARLGRLHALTVSLAAATTCDEVIDVILQQALTALDGISGVVAFTREDGETLDLVGSVGRSPDRHELISFPITSVRPVADAVRTCNTVLVEELEVGGRYGPLLRGWLAGSRSLVAAPLLVTGEARPLGGYCFAFAEPRSFHEDDRLFLLALGGICAQAVERVRLFAAEARARREAEIANIAKDAFLSMLSHELRTPLTAVLGWAHLLQQSSPDPARLQRGLATIERNAALQVRLIEDLLDISRIVANDLKIERSPIDLAVLVEGAVETARPSAEAAGVKLTVAVDPAASSVFGDPDRLQQAVSNVLTNALKFTARGGSVDVRLDRTDGQARIRLVDTGLGIAPDVLPTIFERFRQADGSRTRLHGGLGLGLTIARHLIELHGGTITAESEGVGTGATFTILLPLAAPREAPSAA
jgi:PAS domain S-box-containing protein